MTNFKSPEKHLSPGVKYKVRERWGVIYDAAEDVINTERREFPASQTPKPEMTPYAGSVIDEAQRAEERRQQYIDVLIQNAKAA